MTILTEGPRPGECIIDEAENDRSREIITITASQTLLANQVIGSVVTAATVGAAAAVAGNTGNGTIAAGSPAFLGTVQQGTYRILFRSATRFDVIDPNGLNIGSGVAGTAFSNQIVFTFTAGGTAMVAGDAFTIAVSALTTRWGAYDPAATDGRAVPRGVLFEGVTTGSGATARGVGIVRAAQINAKKLQWLGGLNDAQRTAAIALLNGQAGGLTVRTL